MLHEKYETRRINIVNNKLIFEWNEKTDDWIENAAEHSEFVVKTSHIYIWNQQMSINGSHLASFQSQTFVPKPTESFSRQQGVNRYSNNE